MRSAKMALLRNGQNVIYVCLVLSLFVGSLNAECCKDGETKIDVDDCTKYLVCCSGEFVSKTCPNETYWDPESALCQVDNGECRPPTPCVDGETEVDEDDCTKYFVCCHGELVSMSCDNGYYWNSDDQKCDLDKGQCKPPTCVDGEVNPNPEDCAGYLECVNGSYVNQTCDSGDYFNSTLNKCVLDTCGVCVNCVEGSQKADQNDCAKFQVCVNGKYVSKSCPIGEYYNSAINDCEEDNGQCNGNQTCTEGDIQEDAKDCAGYEVCSNGSWVSRLCADGAYFNATLNICIIDEWGFCLNCTDGDLQAYPADCTKFKICTNGKYVVKSCGSGDYWNSGSKKCEKDDGQCNGNQTCNNGDLEIDYTNCAGYYVCSNGSWVSRECVAGSYFNDTIGACIVDELGVCVNCTDGDLEAYPSDCTKFKICTNGKYVVKSCDSGDYWNAGIKKCEKDDGQCNGNQTCNNGDLEIDYTNCAGYYVCSNGSWVSRECVAGSYFNDTIGACIVDELGVCVNCTDGDLEAYPSDCTKFKICTNGKYVVKSCDSGDYWNAGIKKCEKDDGQCNGNQTCNNGDLEIDYTNCAGYYVCSNGSWVSRECVAGSYFNETIGACIIDELGVCVNCTEGTTGSVPSDCTKYKICAGGKYVVQSCASGLYFNNQTNRCETDNGECIVVPSCTEYEVKVNPADCAGYLQCINGNFVARKCSASQFFNATVERCEMDVNNVCIPKDCDPECCENPNAPSLPVANNCSAFIQCVDGKLFQQNCPSNLQYNNVTKECDFPWVVGCEDGAPPPIAGPSGTYCESHGDCIGQRDGVMFAVKTSAKTCSSSYVVCQCECEVNFTCSAGLVFNPTQKVCDWPDNVEC